MSATIEREEYLAEIREHVCARCVERPPGGPPCEPLGKRCGVEQNLPQLIDTIRDIHSGSIVPYWERIKANVCEHCRFRHPAVCPCPMDYLLVLVAEAVEAVDARHAQQEAGRP